MDKYLALVNKSYQLSENLRDIRHNPFLSFVIEISGK